MAQSAPPLPEPVITRFQAQRKLGLFAPLDGTCLVLIVFLWMTLGFWKLFGAPELLHLLAFAVINLVVMLAWLILLVYRVLVFILDLHADVGLMPEAAARIVAGYQRG